MQRSERRYVPTKFDLPVYEAIVAFAKQNQSLYYDHNDELGPRPSVSAAVRQLVAEALQARGIAV